MADIPPSNPVPGSSGAVPPPKKDTGKVQPKKETVRITLPPVGAGVPTGAPQGAVPQKKETGKVQPKKETVRINLPPKPTAAPTIKLPTLPPGGPTGAPSPVGASAAAPAPGLRTTAAAAAPVKAGVGAPVAATKAAPMAQRAAAPIVPTIKPMDKALIFAAAVTSLIAVGGVTWVFVTLKNTVETFQN